MASITCNTCGALNEPQASYCRSCGQTLQVANAGAGNAFNMGTGRLLPNYLLKQRYRIIHTIGKGGMGAVYVAEDTQRGNGVVAIKEMSQSGMTPQKVREATNNFEKEANMLARLQHIHLPSFYDHFSESGRWYLVMSFIQGETLHEYQVKAPGKKLPVKEVLSIGIQLCTVLDYLHNQQPPIIFRDLKPANIMLTPDGHLYLIDFGIARLFKPGQATDTAAYGSVGYSAPEQYGQAQTTPRSDIYSLGAVLHQLLSGYSPAISPFHFASLQSADHNVPYALDQLILQMVEMKEVQRPANAASVKQALQQIADAVSGSASSTPSASAAAPYAATVLVKNVPSMSQIPQMPQIPSMSQMPPVSPDPPTQQELLPPTVPVQRPQLQTQTRMQAPAGKTSAWAIGRQQLLAMLIGTVICGLLLFLWLQSPISNGPTIDERLVLICATLVFTFFLAALYGPWVGLIVGGLSSFAADLSSGTLGLNWYLDLGLAVAGFVVGLTFLRATRRQSTTRDIVFVDAMSALALLIYTIFAVLGLLLTGQMGSGDSFVLALIYGATYLVITLIALTLLFSIYNIVVRRRATPVMSK